MGVPVQFTLTPTTLWHKSDVRLRFTADESTLQFHTENPNISNIRIRRDHISWTENTTMYVYASQQFITLETTSVSQVCVVTVYLTSTLIAAMGSIPSAWEIVLTAIDMASNVYAVTTGIGLFAVFGGFWDPLVPTTDGGYMLYQFHESVPATGCASVLFDGTEYENNVVGIAYVGGACTAYAHAIVSYIDPFYMAVVLAHEVGHLQTALHTSSYPDCALSQTIMKADIGGVHLFFSTCVATVLQEWTADVIDTCFYSYDPITNATQPIPRGSANVWPYLITALSMVLAYVISTLPLTSIE